MPEGNDKLIKCYKINKLFGYKDFEYEFEHKDTIFVAENGAGKTTILSILFHVLSGNFEELAKFEFESVEIQFSGKESNIIKHEALRNISSLSVDRMISRWSTDDKMDKIDVVFVMRVILNVMEEHSINSLTKLTSEDSIEALQDRLENEGYYLSLHQILDFISFMKYTLIGTDEERVALRDLLAYKIVRDQVLKGHKILYFPTYRRIEEDITDIMSFSIDSNRDYAHDYRRIVRSDKSQSKNQNVGELIQFGMNDVQRTIDKLLDTIKEDSIKGFNTMTGELLSQYVHKKLGDRDRIKQLKEKDLEIVLNRVGTQIDGKLKDTILEQFKEDRFGENEYLINFILNLVKKNEKLEPIDQKIETFVEVCNNYLFDKEFVYDPSAVTLEIIINEQNRKLELSKLSSGEKQIVSTFSKMYLEDNDKLIVLFDEPELSLSLVWQKNFIYDITQAENCKFSVTVTHSPYIFDKLFENTKELGKSIRKR